MKNGILLVEYIQQLRHEGMELRPALLLAGRTRFRPILMTSMAAILGLAPLALGIGPGAQMQQPLAIMVIGGITANMLFTRMIIPVGYLVLERRRERKPLAVAIVLDQERGGNGVNDSTSQSPMGQSLARDDRGRAGAADRG
jgi:predicted RND superfamily exporter protein